MKRILVVDDEKGIRKLIREFLSGSEYDIVEASDGVEATQIVNSQNVDLVITDLVMPEKNGLDLIMELKGAKKGLQVIAISGGGGIAGRFDYLPIAALVGAHSILQKPFDPSTLRTLVKTLLGAPQG